MKCFFCGLLLQFRISFDPWCFFRAAQQLAPEIVCHCELCNARRAALVWPKNQQQVSANLSMESFSCFSVKRKLMWKCRCCRLHFFTNNDSVALILVVLALSVEKMVTSLDCKIWATYLVSSLHTCKATLFWRLDTGN